MEDETLAYCPAQPHRPLLPLDVVPVNPPTGAGRLRDGDLGHVVAEFVKAGPILGLGGHQLRDIFARKLRDRHQLVVGDLDDLHAANVKQGSESVDRVSIELAALTSSKVCQWT